MRHFPIDRKTAYRGRAALAAILAAGILHGAPVLAQETTQTAPPPQEQHSGGHEGFGVQVIGGPIFASLTASGTGISTGNKTGYLVGLAMGGNRGGILGVEADVLYGQKGATINGADFDQHIVDVPVMLKVNLGSDSRNGLSFFGVGGGFFDWQFNSKLASVDVSKDTDGYEVGYVVGGGVELLRLSVQARYIRGLREIDRTFNLANSSDAKTQAVAILFALRLN